MGHISATSTVTGCDSNRDGVVDGFEDLANDQQDIEDGFIRPGGPLDDMLDFINPQPFSPPGGGDSIPEPSGSEDESTNQFDDIQRHLLELFSGANRA